MVGHPFADLNSLNVNGTSTASPQEVIFDWQRVGKGGAPCTVPALCPHCTKRRLFSTIFPDGQGDHRNHCVPTHRTAQIPTQSKNSDKQLKRTMFHTEIGCCLNLLFVPCGQMLPRWWVVFRVLMGKRYYDWVLCPCCAGMPPRCVDALCASEHLTGAPPLSFYTYVAATPSFGVRI